MSELLVIVPSRGRPESLVRVVEAWAATGAYTDGARLVFVVDADDPKHDAYWDGPIPAATGRTMVEIVTDDRWRPMVHKLNRAAYLAATGDPGYSAVAFMGDDHLPRTPGWAATYLAELRQLGTGIVYGDDGIQGQRLPTQWAMTADIIRALGRMVPADVEHLYCDNAIKDLGEQAGCLRYLPDVLIEHMHPVAGKAAMDAGYQRVNRREQYRKDRLAYELWKRVDLAINAGVIRTIRDWAEATRG